MVGFKNNQNIYACSKSEKLETHCESSLDCMGIVFANCNTNKKCECLLNYSVVNGTECFPLLGGKCWRNDECLVNNSVCIDEQCVCKPGFISKFNDQCIRSQLGRYCENDHMCNDIMHAQCSENMCTCRSQHSVKNSAKCLSHLGGYCKNSKECAPENSICIDNKCQCNNEYISKTNEQCVPTPLGKACQNNDNCNEISFTECLDNKCVCKKNYLVVNNTRCSPLLEEICNDDESCAVDNSACINNKCQCNTHFVAEYNDKCVPRRSCSNDYECGDIWHSECSDRRRCVCKKNHIVVDNSRCLPLLGGLCFPGDHCAPDNSVCIHNSCQCNSNYRVKSNNQCIPIQLGQSCKSNRDCEEKLHAVCSIDKICVCRENNVFLNNSTCAPILGGYCDASNLCVPDNSVCINDKCQCKKDFTSISNYQCLPLWD
ncbi:prion-like-(Q/N-rich) domain-bearing protein 25 isoform X2 [Microplitis mediator]|uniref:prion-like-(Q/N-rich) domain-bearing protein 25 isoform X2 n=1 Tax=Microplitis mediator TaxID=375433 RepID=UPI002554F260|nr:prion-like-(Q/N-rich) domain-bearing protein 25 isoform X2 [Microplitis mediator]